MTPPAIIEPITVTGSGCVVRVFMNEELGVGESAIELLLTRTGSSVFFFDGAGRGEARFRRPISFANRACMRSKSFAACSFMGP